MDSSVQDSFLNKAMQMCVCMMKFTGCELYSHNTRSLLEGLNSVLNTLDNAPADKVGSIKLLIDTLLEEEGIAEAELLAGCDSEPDYDDYDDYDWPEDDYPEDYDDYYQYPDPMRSAAEAFEAEDEDRYEQYLAEDSEMEEYVNTPHDDVNVELKQIDEEMKERKEMLDDEKYGAALKYMMELLNS